MRTYDEIRADARVGSAFSSWAQYAIWACQHGCWTCRNDAEGQCPIFSVAAAAARVEATERRPIFSVASASARTPAEWTAATADDAYYGKYTCSEYEERLNAPDRTPFAARQLDLFELGGGGNG